MKIKSLGFKVIDEESGIVFELIPKTEEANQELVEKFFDSFQVLKVETLKVEHLKEEKKSLKKAKHEKPLIPTELRKLKPEKITKPVKVKREKKSIPNPLERQTKELADLPEEFVIADIADLFEKEGYDRKKIMENAYHDIYSMIEKSKIIPLEGKKPKKYKIVSRDTSDLG
jgi:hypothetical protein